MASEKAQTVLGVLGLVVAGPMLYFFVVVDPLKPEKAEASPEEQLMASARYACRSIIRDQLHDPSSAEWGRSSGNWFATWPAQIDEGEQVTVAPRFRAANGFGATIISEWRCVVQRTDDQWRAIRLDQI